MGGHLKVTDRRMAAAVTLVFAEPLVAGTPSLGRSVMGEGVCNSGSFAQRGTSTFGFALRSELRLALCVLTDMQGPALAQLGFGALRSRWARLTGAGWK